MDNMNTRIIRNFLELPAESLPSASFVDDAANSYANAWQTLRNAADGDKTEWIDGPIRLRADRDGWRDGVIVHAEMNANEINLTTAILTYNQAEDELYADGVHIGGADALTRELMLARLDESWHGDSDETLFDACVETVSPTQAVASASLKRRMT